MIFILGEGKRGGGHLSYIVPFLVRRLYIACKQSQKVMCF